MSYTPDEKDIMRIRDIIKKSKGNTDKIISLSQTMANKITDATKAGRRAVASDIIAREVLTDLEFDIFLGLVKASSIFADRTRHLARTGTFLYHNGTEYAPYPFISETDFVSKDSVNTLII